MSALTPCMHHGRESSDVRMFDYTVLIRRLAKEDALVSQRKNRQYAKFMVIRLKRETDGDRERDSYFKNNIKLIYFPSNKVILFAYPISIILYSLYTCFR